jgi:Sortase domain
MAEPGPERVLAVSAPDPTGVDQYREDRPGPPGTTEPSSTAIRPPMLRHMELTRRRRRALSTFLAFVLAIESVSAVAAAAQVGTGRTGAHVAHEAPVAALPARAGAAIAVHSIGLRLEDRALDPVAHVTLPHALAAEPQRATTPARETKQAGASGTRHHDRRGAAAAQPKVHHPKATHPSRATHTGRRHSSGGAPSYSGRNHVWIPSLGINRSVAWFACSRSREPDNYVYRWGCAGTNNVYLLGHAWGVFDPLHDAYVTGRLQRGLKAVYADANGKVRTYAVRWWKVVKPTASASWAWASLPTPSMTLQTCVGAHSQYRLMVRLTQVDN